MDGSLRLWRCCGNRVDCLGRLDGPVDKSVWTLQSCRSNQAEVAVVAASYVGEGEPPEMWLWNLGTGEAVGVHEPDSHFIGMADLGGGCLLACGEGSDEDASTLHVWNVSGLPAAQRELAVAVLDATCSPVSAAVFPADCGAGQSVMVAVGGIAGSLQLWRWDPADDDHGFGELMQLDGAHGGTAVPMLDVDNQPGNPRASRLRQKLDGITSIAGALPPCDFNFALLHEGQSRSKLKQSALLRSASGTKRATPLQGKDRHWAFVRRHRLVGALGKPVGALGRRISGPPAARAPLDPQTAEAASEHSRSRRPRRGRGSPASVRPRPP